MSSVDELVAWLQGCLDEDPARVLRKTEAQRRLVSLHAEPHECPAWDAAIGEVYTGYFGGSEPCPTLRLLAQEYGREEPPRPAV